MLFRSAIWDEPASPQVYSTPSSATQTCVHQCFDQRLDLWWRSGHLRHAYVASRVKPKVRACGRLLQPPVSRTLRPLAHQLLPALSALTCDTRQPRDWRGFGERVQTYPIWNTDCPAKPTDWPEESATRINYTQWFTDARPGNNSRDALQAGRSPELQARGGHSARCNPAHQRERRRGPCPSYVVDHIVLHRWPYPAYLGIFRCLNRISTAQMLSNGDILFVGWSTT